MYPNRCSSLVEPIPCQVLYTVLPLSHPDVDSGIQPYTLPEASGNQGYQATGRSGMVVRIIRYTVVCTITIVSINETIIASFAIIPTLIIITTITVFCF